MKMAKYTKYINSEPKIDSKFIAYGRARPGFEPGTPLTLSIPLDQRASYVFLKNYAGF